MAVADNPIKAPERTNAPADGGTTVEHGSNASMFEDAYGGLLTGQPSTGQDRQGDRSNGAQGAAESQPTAKDNTGPKPVLGAPIEPDQVVFSKIDYSDSVKGTPTIIPKSDAPNVETNHLGVVDTDHPMTKAPPLEPFKKASN